MLLTRIGTKFLAVIVLAQGLDADNNEIRILDDQEAGQHWRNELPLGYVIGGAAR